MQIIAIKTRKTTTKGKDKRMQDTASSVPAENDFIRKRDNFKQTGKASEALKSAHWNDFHLAYGSLTPETKQTLGLSGE